MSISKHRVLVLAVVALCCVGFISADGPEQVYRLPPDEIARVVDAPFTPTLSISPDAGAALVLTRPGLPGIAEVAQPELRLAGLRINPRNFGPSRAWYYTDVEVRTLDGEDTRPVTGLPEDARFKTVTWSPDSRKAALMMAFSDRVELWMIDVARSEVSRLLNRPLNPSYASAFRWLPDSSGLIAATVPEDHGTPPSEPLVPSGPVIQENLGRVAPARTFQDLLQNPHDERVFTYYATSQLVLVSLDGTTRELGEKGLIWDYSPSPDGEWLLVETTKSPFSYTVPASRFPLLIEAWRLGGAQRHTIADLPLADDIPVPFGSVRKGPRSVSWRDDTDATLVWAEALDGGDAGAEVELRDRIVMQPAPFDDPPEALLEMDQRFGGVYWGSDRLAIAFGWWWQTRNLKAWRLFPGEPEAAPTVLMEFSFEDRYSDPGRPLTRPTSRGTSVLLTADEDRTIFLSGAGASPEGDRPFLDEMDLASGETTRLFRSEAPYYEQPVRLLDADERRLITRREAKDIQPNYWFRDLRSDDTRQITSFPHPNPQFSGVFKEQIRYPREDGVELTATLYLPAGYEAEKDGPLPMLMWAYPQEFKSADAAGQVTDSPHRFIRVTYWSPMLWLARGYAVLDDPTMPVVGEGETEPNDTFVVQLVASAEAAVEEVVRRGVADRDRIAIGGHSYGAFMTANLLAHSDLYRAGIARSGAYNRTLTPFGFQAEERTLWQAFDVYAAMSPFMHADRIDEPILLIHGAADNNSGTYPMQSERFYGALKGLGATARLVMLPDESHGYRARESIMHMLWEMSEWMDRWVKNAEPRPSEEE